MIHSSNLNLFIMSLSQFIPEAYLFGMLFLLLGIFLAWQYLRIYKCHRLKTIHPNNSNSTRFVPKKTTVCHSLIISDFEPRYLHRVEICDAMLKIFVGVKSTIGY